ncbi:MAG TPA: hypothetical protein DEH65_18095, partial [Delftia acidovorans]|nr:hypothetical protein [Delftia acidovorans]
LQQAGEQVFVLAGHALQAVVRQGFLPRGGGHAQGGLVILQRLLQGVGQRFGVGLLAAHADPESLADALQQALQDDEAALRMAATARQEALSHYSLQRMTGQYEDLFARLLQGERP